MRCFGGGVAWLGVGLRLYCGHLVRCRMDIVEVMWSIYGLPGGLGRVARSAPFLAWMEVSHPWAQRVCVLYRVAHERHYFDG